MESELSRAYWKDRRGKFNIHLALAGLITIVFALVIGHPAPEPYAIYGLPLTALIVALVGNGLYSMIGASERIASTFLGSRLDAWRARVFGLVVFSMYAASVLASAARLLRR